MIIPEVIIHKALVGATKSIVADLAANSGDETQSRLYDMFGLDEAGDAIVLEDFNYFTQAKQLIKSGSQRQLQFFIGYNLERFHIPTVHILLPNEAAKLSGVAGSEGYQKKGNTDNFYINNGDYTPAYTFGSECTYMLLITSDNYHDVIITYHYLKYILSAMFPHFELSGFQNINIGGTDLEINFEIIPSGVFHRKITMRFTYDYHVLNFSSLKVPSSIPFTVSGGNITMESEP